MAFKQRVRFDELGRGDKTIKNKRKRGINNDQEEKSLKGKKVVKGG